MPALPQQSVETSHITNLPITSPRHYCHLEHRHSCLAHHHSCPEQHHS
jgi:hypothetical protein